MQADDLDGEIDLRSCTDVTEFAVQRNYGFQIHVSVQHCVDIEQWHQGTPGGHLCSLPMPRCQEASHANLCQDGGPARLVGDTWVIALRDTSAACLQKKEEEEALQGWPKAILEVAQEPG